MALTTATFTNIYTTTYVDRILNSTAEEIATSAIVVYATELDNSANTAASYAKFYDVASAPSVGTANPEMILRIPAATKMLVVFSQSIGVNGFVCLSGLFIVGVTSKGTSGSVSPASDFIGTLYTN